VAARKRRQRLEPVKECARAKGGERHVIYDRPLKCAGSGVRPWDDTVPATNSGTQKIDSVWTESRGYETSDLLHSELVVDDVLRTTAASELPEPAPSGRREGLE
jgi:hypothetical protein